MKAGKVILIAGTLFGLAYGGSKLYLHQKVTTELDKSIAMAQPFVAISYRDVKSDLLEGTLSVEGIQINPPDLTEGLSIGQVRVRGEGPGFLLDLMMNGLGPEPPKQLQVEFRGMLIPLDLALAAQPNPTAGLSGNKKPGVCTLGGILQYTGLDKLDYGELVASGFIRYRIPPLGNSLSLTMAYDLERVASTRFEVDVSGEISPAAMAFGAQPTVDTLSIQYQMDPEYSQGITQYCASQKNQKPEQFLNDLFAMDDAGYAEAVGFVPGPGLRTVLRKLVTGPSELDISANPSPNLTAANIGLYKPEQLVDLLDVEMSIDDQLITDMSYQLASKSKRLFANLANTGAAKDKKGVKAKRKKVVRRFLPVKVPLLKNNIGRELKIYSNEAEKPREGVLTAVVNDVATVEQRIYGGKVELHVPFKKIQRVEVLTVIRSD